jgi:ABC-type sugar transport system ATPase subunit
MSTDQPFLSVSHISKRFGITQALDDVSVTFAAGEVHALMGENGAGKSTLGKTIAGLHKQDAGTVTIAGRELPPGDLEAAFDAGIRIVHQELAQCPNLTVAENLCLHDLPTTRFGTVDRREMGRRATKLLERIEPGIDPFAPLGSLSPGRRQIVQIAASLDERGNAGGHSARVIVFDEPTSSLSLTETERLLQIIRQLAASGICCIYVSHRMGEIFAVCDRATVLRDGKYIATTPIKELDEPSLVEQMIGRRLSAPVRRVVEKSFSSGEAAALSDLAPGHSAQNARAQDSGPLLSASSLSSPGKLHSVSLAVRPGEILGIGGLVGSGRSELLDALFGLDSAATGQVQIGGKPLDLSSPRHAIRAGVGYVPEDRRLQGLFFQLGIAENILIPIMPRLARAGIRSIGAERALTTDRIREFQVKAASSAALPGSLSGGNQQKLLIARWMSRDVRVLLLDEPTRGIDVGTKAEVYKLVRAAADRPGNPAAIVLVSSEMPELLALSDRIIVLAEGRVAGELRGEQMTQANILKLAAFESPGRPESTPRR